MISAAGRDLSSSIVVFPSCVASATPCASPSASVAIFELGLNTVPLSQIARSKSPFASGEATSALTDAEPADSPKIVTFPGLPPKAAILRFTHFRAAIWSRMA